MVFAPYEKQESTEFRTKTASDRLYNEIVEGIRDLWKAEKYKSLHQYRLRPPL